MAEQARTVHHPAPRHEIFSTSEALNQIRNEPEGWAVFLDIDGCLLDLAPTPDSIVVPEGLATDIDRLSKRLGGAVALVTGRALIYADALFKPFVFPIAGLHGAEMRGPDGSRIFAEIPPEFERLKEILVLDTSRMPGVLIEDKGGAVAAHYRLAPQFEEVLGEKMSAFAKAAGPGWALQLGKMVYEIRPSRASKGDAVERFLREPPFLDRLPLAMGDDLTDESMFAVVNARGGHSIRVGREEAPTCALSTIMSPAHVRDAIAKLGLLDD
ncbi:trehalose-phosphatase [Rhizobium sp. TH2]|uniref:trehalose-phosphatase n=1 Tax=Rhizobium sp. TH2 TaxID=2775403 RepID=UPI0021588F42|nr:trehalose-phosphatase [Rhizobium sp. TH2]UVC10152.1 trehalose-phosphatase [Rhizobium sp. TH2]